MQLGKPVEGEKPKRASIPKGYDPKDANLDLALRLLSLPRTLGAHPETGKEITAGIGRYGPFVLHDGVYANLPNAEEVFTVGINRAVDLLAERSNKSRRAASTALRELGEHPDGGGSISVMEGRYGPYVKFGKINATLPRDVRPQDVTLEQALELIAAKAAKGKKPGRKATKKATKKAAAKA